MKTWTPTDDPADIVVPGLDPSAPYEDQIELLDQLITLKLQQTDEHWAAIHNMIINELLPSVKRYSQNSQPTREAAHFWKTFYETAADIQLPNPGGETSNAGNAEEEAVDEHVEDEDGNAEASYSSDYTPVDHSFNPAVASTPGRPLGTLDMYRSDADTTGTSTASSFPNFSAPQHPSDADESSFGDSPSVRGPDVKGKGRAADEPTITSTSISHSSANIFTVSPVKPRKSKGKVELREHLLRQKHKQAATPVRAKNPFRKSTVPTPHGDVVDLSRYSPSSSDATIQLDLSPSVKLKAFSTPQYKLALRTKEDAVAIQMSEARARVSDYSSSDDFSAPPTPMNASRRAKQQKDEKAALQARFDRDMARSAGLLPSDGSSDEDDGPDNAVSDSDSDSFLNDGDSPSGGGIRDGDSFDSGTFQLEGMGDQSNLMQGSVANNADSDSDSFVERDRFDLDDLDDALDQPNSNLPAQPTGTHLSYDDTDGYSGVSSSRGPDHTAPTETIFGVRPADKLISQADWERKLSRPLPGRVLPDQPFDSPTPADPAAGKRTSGPSKGRY